MAELIRNRLIITCQDSELRNKIKEVIFMNNENNEKIFTMKKLLPIPAEFTRSDEYNEYGYDWCIAIWGTKWEVINSRISESGETISISYLTASDSNGKWVESLCRFIYVMSYIKCLKDCIKISVIHSFYKLYEGFGCKMIWDPKSGSRYLEENESLI